MATQAQQPYVNTREDSAVLFLGMPTLMRSMGETTNGAFGLMEHWAMPPGFATPYHLHHLEDEAFYVLEGEVSFVCDANGSRLDRARTSSGRAKFLTASGLKVLSLQEC